MSEDPKVIAEQVRALPTIAEPEGWRHTPILDDWAWQRSGGDDLVIVGGIHGHGVVGDGKPWCTEVITGLDRDGRFVTDLERCVYRLGWPRYVPLTGEPLWPPVLHVASQSQLRCAVDVAFRMTGAHTLPAEMLVFLDTAYARKASRKERREAAERMAEVLFRQNRNNVAAAWMAIATDLGDSISRSTTAASIDWAVRDVEKEQQRECTTAETRARNGWDLLAAMEDEQVGRLVSVARLDRTDPIAAAHAVAEIAKAMPKKAVKSLATTIFDDDEPIIRDVDAGDGRVVVLREVGFDRTERGREVVRALSAVVGKPLPLVKVPDLEDVGRTLRGEFPYAAEQIDVVLSDLIGAPFCRLRPTCFSGPPGCGKSRLSERVAAVLGLNATNYAAGATADSSFGGTDRRWSTGAPSVPLRAMVAAGSPCTAVLLDEVEKAGTSSHNGNFAHSLLGFLELNQTGAKYPDPYADAPVNCSFITYLATANDPMLMPDMLRDRFRLLRIPPPRREDLPALARTIVHDLARESGSKREWYPDLDPDEVDMADQLWRRSTTMSLRRLREIVSRILVHRADAPRH